MIEQVKTAYRYLLVMGAGLMLLLLSVMVPVLSSDADFSIYNTDWNGCSEIGRETYAAGSFIPTIDLSSSSEDRVVHSSFSELENDIRPSSSALLIIGPDVPFSDEEGDFAHDFMSRGGLILLADDFGTGNDLLGRLNTTTRISGRPLLDLSYMKNSRFCITTEFGDHEMTRNLTMLLMNMPSTVIPSIRASPVVNSSKTSWSSIDGDERRDEDEPFGPFPVLTIERYGRGTLMVLSDPSLLINQMRPEMDNAIFVGNLLDFISRERQSIIIDESHRDLTNPVQFSNSFVAAMEPYQKVGLLVVISMVILSLNTSIPGEITRRTRKFIDRLLSEKTFGPPDGRNPLRIVTERHPDWDVRVLERLIKDIEG